MAACILGSLALGSSADSLTLTYAGKSGHSAHTNLTSRLVGGSMHFVDAASQSFEAFCVEPPQSHAVASDSPVTNTLGGFSPTQAQWLQGLCSTRCAGLSDGYQRGTCQVAVWQIVSESGSTPDPTAATRIWWWRRPFPSQVPTLFSWAAWGWWPWPSAARTEAPNAQAPKPGQAGLSRF